MMKNNEMIMINGYPVSNVKGNNATFQVNIQTSGSITFLFLKSLK
jgi:hypothetical protein